MKATLNPPVIAIGELVQNQVTAAVTGLSVALGTHLASPGQTYGWHVDASLPMVEYVIQRVLTAADVRREIAKARDWFYANKRLLVNGEYGDKYVAVRTQHVALFANDLAELLEKYGARFGDSPAFFGFAGEEGIGFLG